MRKAPAAVVTARPRVHVEGAVDLNSDQARELAAILLEAAAEVDG